MAGFSGVSRYLGDREHERLVRLSVWQELGSERFRAEAAISVDEDEGGLPRSFARASHLAASAAASLSPPPSGNATLRQSNPRSF
jgi:hypothetical protein